MAVSTFSGKRIWGRKLQNKNEQDTEGEEKLQIWQQSNIYSLENSLMMFKAAFKEALCSSAGIMSF